MVYKVVYGKSGKHEIYKKSCIKLHSNLFFWGCVNCQGYQFELEKSLLKLQPNKNHVVHSEGENEVKSSDFRFL